jgi:carboxyl-terminal processing protease
MSYPIILRSAIAAVCFLYAASVSIGEESASPSVPEVLDIDALARKAEVIMTLAVEHHIDPPTSDEMWLAGTQVLQQALTRSRDQFPTGEFPPLNTPELRREFLTRALPRDALAKLQADVGTLPDRLLRAFVGGMLPQGADLMSAREMKRDQSLRANRYVGTGIALSRDQSSEYPVIAALLAGPGPMEQAGGNKGDLIVRIDDQDTHRMPVSQVIELLSGDAGTTVTLELRAPSAEASRTVVVTRGHIRLPSLAGVDGSDPKIPNYRIKDDSPIRYIRIMQINGSTVHDLRLLERRFRLDGGRAVIIDFRGSETRDLHHALLLADALLDGGVIGRLRTKERVQEFRADHDRLFRDMPLAVLVDQETWGSGEWIAAALQDNRAAIVVGEPTAGYAFVSTFIRVPGEDEFLELPTGIFERPSGKSLQKPANRDVAAVGGIVPDRIIPQDTENPRRRRSPNRETDSAVEAAISELTSRIESTEDVTKP